MGVEWESSDPLTRSGALIAVPGIKGGIGGKMRREAAQGGHRLHVEWEEVGDVAFVKRLGILRENDIAVDRVGRGSKETTRTQARNFIAQSLYRAQEQGVQHPT